MWPFNGYQALNCQIKSWLCSRCVYVFDPILMTNKIQAYIYLGSMQIVCYCVIYSITKNIWKLFLSDGLIFMGHLVWNKEILRLKWKTASLMKTASSRCYFLQWSLMKMKFKLSQNIFSKYLVWNWFCQVTRIVFSMP